MDNFTYIIADEQGFKNDYIDGLLAAGYYRMQHFMFTCNDTALDEEGRTIPVFWLRTLVKQCRLTTSARTILNKGAAFSVIIQPARVDEEIEQLYAMYKIHVPFSVSASCADYLHQPLLSQPFTSMMVQVRHEEKLIAAGYFDAGSRSIAGIMNIYHPHYRSYSLGKLLLLKKLQYASENDMQFYYTGYISPQSTRFDYKTFPDPAAVELLLPDKLQWVPYPQVSKEFLTDYYLKYLV